MPGTSDLPSREGLSRFRSDEDGPVVVKSFVPAPLLIPDVPLDVLSFDQALANTGWVWVTHRGGGEYTLQAGMLVPPEMNAKGNELSLRRGGWLFDQIFGMVIEGAPGVVLHEEPPVARGRMSRPESSLLAALAVRNAVGSKAVPVSAQTAKKRFAGDPNADKRLVRQGLLSVFPPAATLKPLNEHIIDALALALVWIETTHGGMGHGK